MVRYLGMFSSASLLVGLVVLAGSGRSRAQDEVPNSYPHDYPGKPSGDFSPEWQECEWMSLLLLFYAVHSSTCILDFLVNDSLPNVAFPLNRSWAGNIPVNRTNHPNDTLFFWAFESSNGSLTAGADENSSAPWAIWLNGGYVVC